MLLRKANKRTPHSCCKDVWVKWKKASEPPYLALPLPFLWIKKRHFEIIHVIVTARTSVSEQGKCFEFLHTLFPLKVDVFWRPKEGMCEDFWLWINLTWLGIRWRHSSMFTFYFLGVLLDLAHVLPRVYRKKEKLHLTNDSSDLRYDGFYLKPLSQL